MKAKLALIVGCVSIAISSDSFAALFNNPQSCRPGCATQASTCFNPNGCSVINSCQCADPNCGDNPCLSRATCCSAFGNVGAVMD